MKTFCKLLFGAALLPASISAQQNTDSIVASWERMLDLDEVVVVAQRPVIKNESDRIVYLIKNDPYAKGLNGMEVLDRIPRVSVVNEQVTVAGKSQVRYIVDGRLLDMPEDAIASRLRNLTASGIDKIEVLTTPPAKYAAGQNVAFVSITTRNESLGTRGNAWGNGTVREDFSYMLGGNISHTTRKIELAADASWNDTKGINDLDRRYMFDSYEKISGRRTHFTNRMLGANGLFKYKFTDRLNGGVVINFSTTRLGSRLADTTVDNGLISESFNNSPARPNNTLTITAFSDWVLDDRGKMLSLTYNWFGKHAKTLSDVITAQQGTDSRVMDEGVNRYSINSVKLDATLPFADFKMEAGAAFTAVGNDTEIHVSDYADGVWMPDNKQSNSFDYDERTVAVYASAEKTFFNSFFTKIGLRYEHTDVKGYQRTGNESHDKSYGYLFPSVSLSWNKAEIGRFAMAYSMGISRPNFADLNPFRYYTTTTDYVSGNPDLSPGISHNAEINYSGRGIYAVLYNSYNHDAIGYITRFNTDGSQFTVPENFINSNKTGLYASYFRSLSDWWNVKLGGELFYSYAKSKIADFRNINDDGWSGKLELNSSWMLNRQKTLILNLRFSHYFPYHDRMIHYESMSLIGCDIRYMLLDNRLTLSASVSDPFGWNITKSKAFYNDFNVTTCNNIHSHAVSFKISYSFGSNKANNVYRDTKERESQRSY